MKAVLAALATMLGLILIVINLRSLDNENNLFAISSFILILAIVFLGLLLLNKYYNKLIVKLPSALILFASYLILVLVIFFGSRLFSIEWAFIAFIISAFLFYDTKIDSRFLISPALIILGYIPFLLISKQNAVAETAAIYVYYFLVAGVGLQIAENIKKYENSFDFDKFIKEFLKKRKLIVFALIITGFIAIDISLINRIKSLELWKWTSIYIFIIALVFYWISELKQEPFRQK
ncbi:hypothetical protein J4466_04230 [Candidatus Pacearchaeota archaeon]|nr:hypothetical protein [Candidatus Pacearchaeota archaeon]